MKKLVVLLLALCLVFAFAACGPEPTEPVVDEQPPAEAPAEEPFVVTACIASEPETIDPTMVSSVDGNTYNVHLFENLMRYVATDDLLGDNPNMLAAELDLGQAESYEVSEDGLTYTFQLRDDIFWSDGEPVEAEDWVYSWRRLCMPETASDYGYLLEGIVVGASDIYSNGADPSVLGITALDAKTLEIQLEAPCPFFLQLCAFGNLMPLRQDVVEAYGAEWTYAEHMVNNGAYLLNEWVHDSYISMTPNPQWHGVDEVGPDEIKWYLSDDETAILSSYQSGEYMFMETFPTDQIPVMVESGDCFIDPAVTTYYLYLNNDNLTDWRVRAAIALAINRENIVENVTQAGQIPAHSLVTGGITDSTGSPWKNGTGERDIQWAYLTEAYPDYDLTAYAGRCELAQDLLAAAVADGFDVNVTIPYRFNNLGSHGAIAEAVQQDVISVLGLNMTMDSTEWSVYTDTLATDRAWSVARLGWQADYLDGSSFIDLFLTGGPYNYSNWSNPEFDALVAQYKTMPGGVERDEVLYAAEALLFSEGGFGVTPLYYYTNFYCMDGVTHAAASPLGFYIFTYAAPEAE